MSDPISMIPLSSLRASKQNVRKTDKSADTDALAKSIEVHGLLQNLTVRPYGSPENDTYEVVAGGRRLVALRKLSKRKAIAPDFQVPCRILEDEDASDTELSLAENELRVPKHPADQFKAFLDASGRWPGCRRDCGAVRCYADGGRPASQARGGQPETHAGLPGRRAVARSTDVLCHHR